MVTLTISTRKRLLLILQGGFVLTKPDNAAFFALEASGQAERHPVLSCAGRPLKQELWAITDAGRAWLRGR